MRIRENQSGSLADGTEMRAPGIWLLEKLIQFSVVGILSISQSDMCLNWKNPLRINNHAALAQERTCNNPIPASHQRGDKLRNREERMG